ncbi:HNH endonuclease [Auritidibacter ignavus]|uniref:HNH endonuclease n=1 Tax=Auritidibacter ignavus TaxID=678932 RepID=UPI00109CA88A|nr:HNH endonuclease signature motif containing protein [Auritidibacter ignavus]
MSPQIPRENSDQTVLAELTTLHQHHRALAESLTLTDESTAIDVISTLEKIQATAVAMQAQAASQLDKLRLDREKAAGIPKNRRGSGLGAEIAMARKQSPERGNGFLNAARIITHHMPGALGAMRSGELSEAHAMTLSREVRGLAPRIITEIDDLLTDQYGRLSPRQLGKRSRGHAQRLDADQLARRAATARKNRRVTTGSAGPGMANLNAYLPSEQVAAVYNTLERDAKKLLAPTQRTTSERHGPADHRTLEQIMADLLVERITGQSKAGNVAAQVNIVLTADAFLGEDNTPAMIAGQGPVPAATVRKWLANPEAKLFLTKLFVDRQTGKMVSMESGSRLFPAGLKKMISLRDDICRTPHCENPVEETDHAQRHTDGGATSYDNGQGLCRVCNQTKEKIGWKHDSDADGLQVTTPTNHTYEAPTDPLLPGSLRPLPPPRPPSQQRQSPRCETCSNDPPDDDSPAGPADPNAPTPSEELQGRDRSDGEFNDYRSGMGAAQVSETRSK